MARHVSTSKAVAHRSERPQQIATPPGTPIDRIGLDLKPAPPKRAHGSRHVMGRSHQQPTFTRFGGRHDLTKDRIFDRIAGTVVDADSAALNPEALKQSEREFR